MEHPTRLVHLLTNLSSQQDPSEPTLNESLDSLDCALAAAVGSSSGLQLMLRRDGYPVVLTLHRTVGRPPDPGGVPPAAARRQPPQEDVLGHRQVGDEAGFLHHDGDAVVERVAG